MQIKPSTPTKPEQTPTSQNTYMLTTAAGREYAITKEDNDQIKKLWTAGENYGIFVLNQGTEAEVTVLMRNIDSISKERRTTE